MRASSCPSANSRSPVQAQMMAKHFFTYGSVDESLTLGSQFHRAPAFVQCLFFSSQACIDQPEIRKQTHIIRVTADLFLLLCACPHKGSARRSFVSFQTSDYTHPKVAAKLRKAPLERILLGKHRRKRARRRPSRDRTKQECSAGPPQMDLSLTQVHWSGSFQLQHAKALCPLAGILRWKHEKSALALRSG